MRTTIALPEKLMKQVKLRAKRQNRSITETIAELVERGISQVEESPSKPRPYKLPPLVKVKGGPLTAEEIHAAIAQGQK